MGNLISCKEDENGLAARESRSCGLWCCGRWLLSFRVSTAVTGSAAAPVVPEVLVVPQMPVFRAIPVASAIEPQQSLRREQGRPLRMEECRTLMQQDILEEAEWRAIKERMRASVASAEARRVAVAASSIAREARRVAAKAHGVAVQANCARRNALLNATSIIDCRGLYTR